MTSPPTHAGAIAIGRHRGRTYVLLVRAKRTTDRVFPKGHIEGKETPEAAALRELREEAGFDGRILESVGDLEHEQDGKRVKVQYFLVRATWRASRGEPGRKPIWVDPRAALTLLRYRRSQWLLRNLLPVIDRIGAGKKRWSKGVSALLMSDFGQLGQSLQNNEEQGEKRVTFFITLVTATAGAMGFFGDKMKPPFGDSWRVLAVTGLLAIFLFGVQTLRRVVERNAVSDGLKLRLDRIRRYFAGSNLRRYRQFLGYDPDAPKARDFKPWPLKGSGGWLDTVVLVNALLLGAIAGLVVWRWGPRDGTIVAAVTFAVAWVVLHRIGSRLHRERWEKEARRL